MTSVPFARQSHRVMENVWLGQHSLSCWRLGECAWAVPGLTLVLVLQRCLCFGVSSLPPRCPVSLSPRGASGECCAGSGVCCRALRGPVGEAVLSPRAQDTGLWAHMLRVTAWLLLPLALWLLTAVGAVHWRLLRASAPVNVVCRGVSFGRKVSPPQAQEPSAEFGSVLPPEGGGPAIPLPPRAWTSCSDSSQLLPNLPAHRELLDDTDCVSFISVSLCLTLGWGLIGICGKKWC